MNPLKLELACHLRAIEGCGDDLRFIVTGHRKLKSGRYQNYELTLKACRFSARLILRELRKMHVRDRERLVNEQQRIEREVRELTTEQA